MRKSLYSVPLIVEPHPVEYTGYKFITLIRYNDENTINIVDNIVNKNIHTYVLDLCGPSEVSETDFVDIAFNWHESGNYLKYPLSIEISMLGYSHVANKILRSFPLDFVTRIIGPVTEYPMSGYSNCRKRKKKSIIDK
jgi:hypothetical protein